MSFLNRFDQIYSRQFGFHKAHSTVNTLINVVERIRERLIQRWGELPVRYLLIFRRPLTVLALKISSLNHTYANTVLSQISNQN